MAEAEVAIERAKFQGTLEATQMGLVVEQYKEAHWTPFAGEISTNAPENLDLSRRGYFNRDDPPLGGIAKQQPIFVKTLGEFLIAAGHNSDCAPVPYV